MIWYSLLHIFESYSNQGRILIHEDNYQQIYHTFVDSGSCQEQTLTFHHFLLVKAVFKLIKVQRKTVI